MSQEIIDTIKQREPVLENTISTVAQYWLDNNTVEVSPSWSHIVAGLEQANEPLLAQQVQERLLMDEETELVTLTATTEEWDIHTTSTELIPQVTSDLAMQGILNIIN